MNSEIAKGWYILGIVTVLAINAVVVYIKLGFGKDYLNKIPDFIDEHIKYNFKFIFIIIAIIIESILLYAISPFITLGYISWWLFQKEK